METRQSILDPAIWPSILPLLGKTREEIAAMLIPIDRDKLPKEQDDEFRREGFSEARN